MEDSLEPQEKPFSGGVLYFIFFLAIENILWGTVFSNPININFQIKLSIREVSDQQNTRPLDVPTLVFLFFPQRMIP